MPIEITSNIRNYDVDFCNLADIPGRLEHYTPYCYAIDETVWKLYRDKLFHAIPESQCIVVPIHEDLKNLTSVQMIYDRLTGFAAKRNLTLISVGGGILQDITGFVASTLYRGINWVFLPTTLLAQADSCIGSKTSLNYKGFKNLIGSFYPPSAVYVCSDFLQTQEDPDFYSGLGEVVKLHIMAGSEAVGELFELLPAIHEKDPSALLAAIHRSLQIKKEYITGDEFDTGRRNLLNFGHCFGHALEASSSYAIPHGQAVVLGIILANLVAVNRGILSMQLHNDLMAKLLKPSLVVYPKENHLNADVIIEAMKQDKKRTGDGLALVMMDDAFGLSRVSDLKPSEVRQVIDQLITQTVYGDHSPDTKQG